MRVGAGHRYEKLVPTASHWSKLYLLGSMPNLTVTDGWFSTGELLTPACELHDSLQRYTKGGASALELKHCLQIDMQEELEYPTTSLKLSYPPLLSSPLYDNGSSRRRISQSGRCPGFMDELHSQSSMGQCS